MAVVALVATAYIGANAMVWHTRLGHAVLALLLFRLVWGFVGGHWSRFSRFLPTPSRVIGYLRGDPAASDGAGHNPLGALSVYAMLLALAAQVATGLLADDEISSAGPLTRFVASATVARATGYHKDVGQWIVIGLLALHVVAVLYYTLVRRKPLVAAMVHGDQPAGATALPPSRDTAATRIGALVLLALCAGVATWVWRLGG